MRSLRPVVLAIVASVPCALSAQQRQPSPTAYDTTQFRAMQWRNIGPFRGGRAVAAAGVTSQPNIYYAGYTGGGVWKTENAGHSWHNVTDGPDGAGMNGSIGAIAVAESDPNVVYVGSGEHAVRGQSSSYGNGVFKSSDAGKTWKSLGLEATKQIAQVRVHPSNPDV
ncbi:MAG TPA: glycosyl hydrolase, partial [Gemmatimonadaceae bacterium]